MAEQIELLEHHADADLGAFVGECARRQRLAVVAEAQTSPADLDRAGLPAFEMVDTAKQRALAGTGGTEQRDHLADPHCQIDTGKYGLLVIALAQAFNVDGDIVAAEHLRPFGVIDQL